MTDRSFVRECETGAKDCLLFKNIVAPFHLCRRMPASSVASRDGDEGAV